MSLRTRSLRRRNLRRRSPRAAKSPWLRVRTLVVASLTIVGATGFARAARAEVPIVVSVHAPAMDWPEARRNVEAELRASGFEVQTRPASVVDPGTLLAELPLHAAEHPGSVGSVTVIRVGSTGLAYVWVRDHGRLFRVDAPSAEANVAAGMLALRVADLMAVRPWKTQEALPPSVTSDEAAGSPDAGVSKAPDAELRASTDPRDWDSRAWVWLGVGGVSGVVPSSLGAQVNLGASIPLGGPTNLDLGGAVSVLPASVRLPEGPVVVSHQQLGAHLMARVEGGERWSLAGGLGGSGLCLQAQGSADETGRGLRDTTCVGLVSARVRILLRWHEMSVWAMAEPGVAMPGVRLRTDQRTDARLGRPWLAAALGVGWRL